MSPTIAKRGIDYYLHLFEEGRRYNPIRRPAIGFYGGEPLLNFKLIKDCVDYVESKYKKYKIRYYITTNGSLLKGEIADWIMGHDFGISVSLDGPEEEHDRNRVYRNKKGTFRDVIENINKIINSGYKNIDSMPVFDWKSDLFKLEEFFNRTDVPPVSRATSVSSNGWSKYYEQFTMEDHQSFLDQLKRAREHYFKEPYCQEKSERPSFFHRLFGESITNTFLMPKSLNYLQLLMPVTSACIPGSKLFVDVNGNFHACEKINYQLPFGNVNEGINFELIRRLRNEYLNHMDKCLNCRVSRRCSHCYLIFMTNEGFLCSSEVCKDVEKDVKTELSESISIVEKNPNVLKKTNISKNIKKYCGD